MSEKNRLLEMHANAPRMPDLGAFGPIVGEIITDLITFAIAHATGRNATARAALAEARMRMDELWGRVNPEK